MSEEKENTNNINEGQQPLALDGANYNEGINKEKSTTESPISQETSGTQEGSAFPLAELRILLKRISQENQSSKINEDGSATIMDNAQVVLEKRYLRRGRDGKILETPHDMFDRVAKAIASIDKTYDPKASMTASTKEFYNIMSSLEFLPNSPTMMNAGTGAGTLSACFVLGLEDSMEGIMDAAKEAALVQKFGGGTGFSLSSIRAKDSPISTTHGKACGPVAVLRHLSSVSTLVTQGGKRDGANMAVMDVRHPDIMEFIESKTQEGQIHNFNISVGADEEFMEKVKAGDDYDIKDPNSDKTIGVLNANKVFTKIVDGAWKNGEPGLILLDRVNQDNPTPHLGRMTATNPCGEQPLLPYESCNLGSINLSKMLVYENDGAAIDWGKIKRITRTAVRFLDNVIDANKYSVPEIENMTKATRKIGLGVMGFADMLVQLGVPYNSQKGLEIGGSVMKYIKEVADKASEKLAKKRGVFPAFKGSIFDKTGGRKFRNACRLPVAPTGTISMIAGCSSGIEPMFALSYKKHNILEGQTLNYIYDLFELLAKEKQFMSDSLMEELSSGESLQNITEIPDSVKQVFVTAPDITPDWHIRMQAVFQDHVDSAISKTINFPNSATVDDVRQSYLLAWELGCKGITVYRANSREKEVLTAGTTSPQAEEEQTLKEETPPIRPLLTPRHRPQSVRGVTERIRTGHGTIYVTINFDEKGKPFELFSTLGKAGGCDSAQLEAISRLVSTSLRSGVDPTEIIDQLNGITCCPAWDNSVQVRSAPDALALALKRALDGKMTNDSPEPISQLGMVTEMPEEVIEQPRPDSTKAIQQDYIGSCPECSGLLAHQEGCVMCRSCGWNRCG